MDNGLLPIRRDKSPTGSSLAGDVVTVVLEQPESPVVVLNDALIAALERTLQALPRDVAGLILASGSERVFVAGADLKTIMAWNDDQLHRYLELGARTFGMLANMPFPTVAAINGAALGGGLEIAMHCDALVAAPSASGKPYPIGLPEAGLRICPGWGGTNLLPARINPAEAINMTASGTPTNFDHAKELGLFDAVAESADALHDACVDWIAANPKAPQRDGAPSRWIGRSATAPAVLSALDDVTQDLPDHDAARAVAEAVGVGLNKGWEAACRRERELLVHLRSTPDAKAAIDAFFAKSAAKAKS